MNLAFNAILERPFLYKINKVINKKYLGHKVIHR